MADEFDHSMGLNFAAAFTAYDANQEPIDDPTVGQLVFNHHKWGRNPDGTVFAGRYRINSHRCTPEELGLVDKNDTTTTEEANMYPMTKGYAGDFEFY